MVSFTIALTDERAEQLKTLAERFQVSPEELLRVSLDELLAKPETDLEEAVGYLLTKNAALYQRLA
jgi:predicted transcriptional regulator